MTPSYGHISKQILVTLPLLMNFSTKDIYGCISFYDVIQMFIFKNTPVGGESVSNVSYSADVLRRPDITRTKDTCRINIEVRN
jgi:hypothetical protein